MKIGVFFEGSLHAGGGFQQTLNMVLLLSRKAKDRHDFVFFTNERSNVEELAKHGVEAHYLRLKRRERWIVRLRSTIGGNHWCNRFGIGNPFDRKLDEFGVDLLYFPNPSGLALMTEKHNFVFTVWDLFHRDFMEFPEVRNYRSFEARESLFQGALPKAVAIITESEHGKQNVIRRYAVDSERVYVIPFSPSEIVTAAASETMSSETTDVRGKYNLDGDFLYYPAQFWPQKNHVYVLEGLKILKDKGRKVSAVFSGSDGGTLDHVQATAKKLGIKDLMHYVGFVPNEDVPCLYRESLALAMPTYCGPTNLPPLEAFLLGTPVLYSNLPGLREQVGDAALLLDLDDPSSLANAVINLQDDENLRKNLVEKGYRQIEELKDEDRWKTLLTIFDQNERRLYCWK